MMENILELINVSKKYNSFTLDNISFKLPKGFIMGFIGPNGAGKTTTIKLILNMIRRENGEIKIFGKDNIIDETTIKEQIGVVMDNPFYVEDWKLSEVGKALKPFYKKWDTDKYNKLLSDFSLDVNKKVKDLSRGMKMKLMIACALSHDANLLILDEPTSGLDAVARNELMEILSTFVCDENKSVLFSTHITSDLEKIADYITFINNGRIMYSDTKDNLLEKYVIIKGAKGILSLKQKNMVIGYQEYNIGFEGIVEVKELINFPKSVVIEKCNLDEIVVRFNIGGKNHE